MQDCLHICFGLKNITFFFDKYLIINHKLVFFIQYQLYYSFRLLSVLPCRDKNHIELILYSTVINKTKEGILGTDVQ